MVLHLLLISPFANAVLPCAPREAVAGSSQAVVDYLLNVNIVDDADRRTAEDYAREHGESKETIEDRYAATGDLNCPGGMSQANVTIKNDIITTAAHSIFPTAKGCGDKNEATKCKFVTQFRGKTETYEVESMVSSGWDCGMYDRKNGSDWAILKLKKPVDPRIKPYRFDKKVSMARGAGEMMTVIGKSDDFPRIGIAPKDAPRHFGDCEKKGGYTYDFNRITLSNCDSGHRASGGAVVTPGPNPILLGVNEGGYEGLNRALERAGKRCPNVNRAKTSGKYSECWASTSTDVSGDFAESLTTIQESVGSSPKEQDDQYPPSRKPPGSAPEQTDL